MADFRFSNGDELRAGARAYAQEAFARLAQALNLFDDARYPHQYSEQVRHDVCEHLVQITALLEEGRIYPNIRHGRYLKHLERLTAAKDDRTLQRTLNRAAQKAPIRKAGHSNG
jgi:hypothetical protein